MATPDASQTDFYDRLGVDRDASPEDIKHAYAAAVREYPPERHPEEFQRIREAFETLSDPESRTEYDATSDPAVEEALERGQEALQDEDYEEAEAAFKRALVLEPDAHFIRNLLGVTLLHKEANAEALDQFDQLTTEFPENHLYWAHRAAAEHRLEKWDPAERHYRRAIEIEPEEVSAYQGLATLLADRERFEEAEQLIERGIHADDVVDFEDITLFFELIKLRLQQGDIDGIQEVAERIESVLTEDWQRTRVAYRFATIAQPLAEVQAFELALALAERSQKLAPEDEEIAQFTKYIRENRAIIEEWKSLAEDHFIRDNLKALYAVGVQEYFDTWESEQTRQSALEQINELAVRESRTAVVVDGQKRTVSSELQRIENVYPNVAPIFTEAFKDQLRGSSVRITHVWLTCPHCGHQARAQDQTARYQCPGCNKAFDYDSSNAVVKTKAAGCTQGLMVVGGYGLMGFLFLVFAQGC